MARGRFGVVAGGGGSGSRWGAMGDGRGTRWRREGGAMRGKTGAGHADLWKIGRGMARVGDVLVDCNILGISVLLVCCGSVFVFVSVISGFLCKFAVCNVKQVCGLRYRKWNR